jgi:hypothetical protein
MYNTRLFHFKSVFHSIDLVSKLHTEKRMIIYFLIYIDKPQSHKYSLQRVWYVTIPTVFNT